MKKIKKTEIRDENYRLKPEVERLMVEMIKEFLKDGEREEEEITNYLEHYFTDKWDKDKGVVEPATMLQQVIGELCDENFKSQVYYSLRTENDFNG